MFTSTTSPKRKFPVEKMWGGYALQSAAKEVGVRVWACGYPTRELTKKKGGTDKRRIIK